MKLDNQNKQSAIKKTINDKVNIISEYNSCLVCYFLEGLPNYLLHHLGQGQIKFLFTGNIPILQKPN